MCRDSETVRCFFQELGLHDYLGPKCRISKTRRRQRVLWVGWKPGHWSEGPCRACCGCANSQSWMLDDSKGVRLLCINNLVYRGRDTATVGFRGQSRLQARARKSGMHPRMMARRKA